MILLSMNVDELKQASDNDKSTALEKAVSNALLKSIEKGSLFNIETIITRAMGKPKESVDVTSNGEKFEITLNLNG